MAKAPSRVGLTITRAPRRASNAIVPPGRQRHSANITERTYRVLLDLIEARQLRPGAVLEERRLAQQLRVSRTPLRSALNRLLGEGVLIRLSNGLPAVREFGAGEFLELMHLRRILEAEACSLAAGRVPSDQLEDLRGRLAKIVETATTSKEQHWILDDEVHDLIAANCGNKSLATLISDVRRRVRMCNIERDPSRLIPACHEHLNIVNALEGADAARARNAMVVHLDNVRRSFLRSLSVAGAHE